MRKTAIKSKREKAIERGMDHPVAVRKITPAKSALDSLKVVV